MAKARTDQTQQDTERYRRAAEDALQQLDWCIGYLHAIHKTQISRALARNRSHIRTHVMHRPEEPSPTAQVERA